LILSIVAVGSVAFDSIETPIGKVERAIGGSATYFSLAASYFLPVNLVAVVGEDFSEDDRTVLLERKIDLDGLTVVDGGKTFFWHGKYGQDPNERESLTTELNVFEGFRPSLPEAYKKTDWLFLGNIDPEIQLEVIDQVKGRPLVGCDTMNFWIERKPDKLLSVLRQVDVFFINDSEARLLSGNINLVSAARTILEMGPTAVVIKKGEHGAFLFTKSFRVFTPAYPLEEVVDPTGAGDSFAGGFVGYLAKMGGLHELNLRRAMYYGTITASFTCESFSIGRLKSLTHEDIDDRFKALVDLVHVQLE
jgi:sugar/nucleoside kinase (ribokinase family)